ncbi:MAG: c-type cytochrome [Isosphaeraceae bacterium]
MLDQFRGLSPQGKAEAVSTLLAREKWTEALLDAIRKGQADATLIDSGRRAMLLAHKNPAIARAAKEVFGSTATAAGGKSLASFAPALKLSGEPARGSKVFEQHCMTCHKVGEKGKAVGPDLTATQFGEPQALLTHILDPNNYVAPNYIQYVVSDRSGRVYTGLMASETASSVTLRRAEGVEETVLRSQIEELASTGKSLMPEDFGSKLTHQDAADLVAFILGARSARPEIERLDIGTLPGLIEPER